MARKLAFAAFAAVDAAERSAAIDCTGTDLIAVACSDVALNARSRRL